MPKKTFTPGQNVTKLREIEVLTSQGTGIPAACKQAGLRCQLLSMAQGIRRPQARAGQTPEGARTRERQAQAC